MYFFLKQKHVVANNGAGGNKIIEVSAFYKHIKSLNVLMMTIPNHRGKKKNKNRTFLLQLLTEYNVMCVCNECKKACLPVYLSVA